METGLKRKLEPDRLNGFIGKTAVHSSQVSVINNFLKISVQDYNDAMNIINWKSKSSGVEKSPEYASIPAAFFLVILAFRLHLLANFHWWGNNVLPVFIKSF